MTLSMVHSGTLNINEKKSQLELIYFGKTLKSYILGIDSSEESSLKIFE